MDQLSYFIFRLIKFGLIFYILFLIFSNPGTFVLIIAAIFLLLYFFINSKIKKMKKQSGTNGFHFKFNARDFQNFQNASGHQGYDFGQGGFSAPSISEVQEAKVFFGFETIPTEQELKKKYRELAKKYHPDINGGDDADMQKLNHYRDILTKSISKD
jgi:hypothetical protein